MRVSFRRRRSAAVIGFVALLLTWVIGAAASAPTVAPSCAAALVEHAHETSLALVPSGRSVEPGPVRWRAWSVPLATAGASRPFTSRAGDDVAPAPGRPRFYVHRVRSSPDADEPPLTALLSFPFRRS